MAGIQSLLQETRTSLEESRKDRARLSVHASELEHENELQRDVIGDMDRDILELKGDLANERQRNQSLQDLLRRAEVSLPPLPEPEHDD